MKNYRTKELRELLLDDDQTWELLEISINEIIKKLEGGDLEYPPTKPHLALPKNSLYFYQKK